MSTAEKPETSKPAATPKVQEWVWVLLLIAALFISDVATYNFYPAVWCDEVLFSEPAINRVQHGTFTTTVWEFQPANTFPVVNCPLYSMTLVPWLATTGTSLLAVRSFNYALMALASLLLWIASWRFDIVKTPILRLLMLGLFHCGYGISFAFRCSRPDILGLNCLLLLFLAFKVRGLWFRRLLLFFLAATTVWIGLQVALFACVAYLAAWFVLRCTGLREFVLLCSGMAFGAGSLALFLKTKGVLAYFLPIVVGIMGKHYAHSAHISISAALFKVLRTTLVCYVEDFTTVFLTLGILAILALGKSHLTIWTRSTIRCCLLLIFAVPAIFNIVGHYAFYYSYMPFVVAVFAVFAAYSELSTALAGRLQFCLKLLLLALIIAGLAVGLPMRLVFVSCCCKLVPRDEMRQMANAHIFRKDIVFSDYAPFFEVKNCADVVYAPYFSSALISTPIPGHDFTPEEKRSISVLVIRPGEANFLTGFFGGQWEPMSKPFGDTQDFSKLEHIPLLGPRFARYATQPQNERYQVQIFRRLPGRGSAE